MDRLFFEEKQKLPAIWTWVVLFVGLGMTSPILAILFNQIVVREEPEANTRSLLIALCLLIILIAVLVWVTAVFCLKVEVTTSGINFHYFPFQLNPRLIEAKTITGFVIREMHWKEVFESRREKSWKIKKSNQIYTVAGKTVLELTLSGDKKVILGTRNKESLARAMKKLLDNPA